MNGDAGVKKAAALNNKVKQVANAATNAANASANGIKKRRKDLKPIITGEGQSGSNPGSAKRYVVCYLNHRPFSAGIRTGNTRNTACIIQLMSPCALALNSCYPLTQTPPPNSPYRIRFEVLSLAMRLLDHLRRC
jgi:hypothetical protein